MTQSNPAAAPADSHVDATKFYGERFQQNPDEVYRELRRAHGAVAPVLLEGDVPAWCVLDYRELIFVTSTPDVFSRDPRRWNGWHLVGPDWSLRPYAEPQPSVILTEAAEHRVRAAPLHQALAAVDHFELRAHVEKVCDHLIDEFAGSGEADLVRQYTHRIPVMAIAKIYGLPDEESEILTQDVALSGEEGTEAVRAHQRVVARMRELAAGRRAAPGHDLVSRLVTDQLGFTDEEIAADLFITLGAGHLTTSDWMGNAIRLMLTEERFAMGLAGGRNSVGQALNEVLWEDTPTQNFVGRWALRDISLAGKRIRKGDLVVLGLAAANADPQVRPDGHAGSTGNHAHLSFSHGEHGCPYSAQEIARTITMTGIEVLLDRLPDVALSIQPHELVWRPSVWMRGLTALPVTFTCY